MATRTCGLLLGVIVTLLIGVGVLAAPPDLEGAWVMLQVYPRVASLPLVGESLQTSYVVQWVDVMQEDDTLTMTDTYCFTVVDDTSLLATTEIPEAFIAALLPEPRTSMLQTEGNVVRFDQPTYIEVRGAVLENPQTDALPIDAEDSRVVDQDQDGFPGMTIQVNLLGFISAQIYVVQRVQYALSGTVISPTRIEGSIDWIDEQIVLAATNSMLLADTTGGPDPDPSKHRFLMLKAETDWSCEWLRENWRSVFEID